MKKVLFIIAAAAGILLMAGCGSPDDPGSGTTLQIGDTETGTAGSETFTMVYANDSTSMEFPTKEDDSGEETLDTRFWIAETETTNAVVAAVLQWAKDNNRIAETAGAHNEVNSTTVKYGGRELIDLDGQYYYSGNADSCRINYADGLFTVDDDYDNHPVIYISWYGAVMICNWLTEMRDGNTDNVVYTGIDETWQQAEMLKENSKNGYRLPGEWEWEYAGRYRGTNTENTVAGYTNPCFTKGDSASGAAANWTNADACKLVAWYSANSGTDGGASNRKSHPVGGKTANTLGLYDISGNVWELCFDAGGTDFVGRGGSWLCCENLLQLGFRTGYLGPDYSLGFRLCRTAD